MKIKNKIITKKDWYLKNIKQYLETYIDYKTCSTDEYSLKLYLQFKGNYEILTDYIKSDLNDSISDDLTCVDGVGGKQDQQIGMIEFINLFSDLNLKIEDFNIIRGKQAVGEVDYCFSVMLVKYKHKYEYLSDFFSDFIYHNSKKILDEIIK